MNTVINLLYVACAYFVSPWVLVLPVADTLFLAFASWVRVIEKEQKSVATLAELDAKVTSQDERLSELSLRVHQGIRR